MNIRTLDRNQSRHGIRIGCLALALLGGESLFAIDYTFNVTTGNWGDTSTWSPTGTPGAGDTVDMTFTATNRKLVLAGETASINTLSKTGSIRWDIVGGSATDSVLNIQTINATKANLIFRNDHTTGGLILNVQNLNAIAGSSTYFGSSTSTAGNRLRGLTVSGSTTAAGNLFFNIVNDDGNSYALGHLTVDGAQGVHLNVTDNIGKASTVRVTGLSGTGGYIRNSDRAGATNSSTLEINNSADFSSATVIRNGGGTGADTTDHGVLSLRKLGVGTQTLTGANTYTGGTVISEGALRMGAGGTAGSIVGDVNIEGSDAKFIIDRSNAGAFEGTISGNGSFVKAGAGTWTLSGANTYAGGTVIENGRIRISSDENLGASSGSVTFAAEAPATTSLEFTSGVTSSRNIIINAPVVRLSTEDSDGETGGLNTTTLSGTIGGAGGIDKRFVGNLILTGDNTYAGTTTVTSGTLLVNGTHTGGGAYAVSNNGTLGGTGAISASGVTFGSAGKLSAGGFGTGTLSFNLGAGSLDLSAIDTAGSLLFDLGAVGASDTIALSSGTLNIGTLNFSDFSFNVSEGFGVGEYVLFDASSTIVGSILQSSGTVGGLAATLSLDNVNHNIVLTVSAIPEPGAFAVLAGVAALGCVLGRRSRRAA